MHPAGYIARPRKDDGPNPNGSNAESKNKSKKVRSKPRGPKRTDNVNERIYSCALFDTFTICCASTARTLARYQRTVRCKEQAPFTWNTPWTSHVELPPIHRLPDDRTVPTRRLPANFHSVSVSNAPWYLVPNS